MICNVLIYIFGIVTGYIFTKIGYCDLFIEQVSDKMKKEKEKLIIKGFHPLKK